MNPPCGGGTSDIHAALRAADPGRVLGAARGWRLAAARLCELRDVLTHTAAQGASAWTGAGAERFTTRCHELAAAADRLAGHGNTVHERLTDAAHALAQAREHAVDPPSARHAATRLDAAYRDLGTRLPELPDTLGPCTGSTASTTTLTALAHTGPGSGVEVAAYAQDAAPAKLPARPSVAGTDSATPPGSCDPSSPSPGCARPAPSPNPYPTRSVDTDTASTMCLAARSRGEPAPSPTATATDLAPSPPRPVPAVLGVPLPRPARPIASPGFGPRTHHAAPPPPVTGARVAPGLRADHATSTGTAAATRDASLARDPVPDIVGGAPRAADVHPPGPPMWPTAPTVSGHSTGQPRRAARPTRYAFRPAEEWWQDPPAEPAPGRR